MLLYTNNNSFLIKINHMSILALHKQIINSEVKVEKLVKQTVDDAMKYNPELNALNTLINDIEFSKIGSMRSLLAGIPMTVKDVYLTKGIRSTASTKFLDKYIPQYSSTVFEMIEKAGAIMIGKNNCDVFAFGASGENSGYGATKNPLCMSKVSGGSSSGSAAAVAAGIGVYSLGTDTGGSIRQPAALCGVYGLKATYGRNSRYGITAMGSSWDTPGVIAKSVEDCLIVQKYLEGDDIHDSTTRNPKNEDFNRNSIEDFVVSNPNLKSIFDMDYFKKYSLKGMKIGLPKEYFIDGIDPDIEKGVRAAAEKFRQLGAEIVDISLPHTKYAVPVYYILISSEISSNMGRYEGLRYGGLSKEDQEKLGVNNLESFYKENRNLFEDEVKRRIMIGTYTLAKGYSDQYYKKAMQVRTLIKKDFDEAYKLVDVILAPVSPQVAWDIGSKTDDPVFNYLADVFTIPVNAAGICSLSMPCGEKKFDEVIGQNYRGEDVKSLPIGMQIIGPEFKEDLICWVGNEWEKMI